MEEFMVALRDFGFPPKNRASFWSWCHFLLRPPLSNPFSPNVCFIFGLQAKRYVTQERLQQMLETEYDIVDSNLRDLKGGGGG